jgi:NAD(P)-dependent dehydrogenase (short-subunit alcohol dehydrogenase family)
MTLEGQVAVVTGGGGAGSGGAIARRLAREGATVVIADVSEERARETAAAIAADGPRATALTVDVADEAAVRGLFERVEAAHGGCDILVNNASGLIYPEQSFDDSLANLRVDLLGTMYATRYAIEAMRRRGGGAIVNIGSTSALPHGDLRADGPGGSGYNTAKAGVIRFTTTLAWMGPKQRIRVNCLAPHWIGTEHIKAAIAGMTADERRAWAVPDVLISPEEMADAVLRLATDEQLAGRVMVLYGGRPGRLIPLGDPGFAELENS